MRNPSTKSITLAVTLAATLVASVPTPSHAADRGARTQQTNQSRETERVTLSGWLSRMLQEVKALADQIIVPVPKESPTDPTSPSKPTTTEDQLTVPIPQQ